VCAPGDSGRRRRRRRRRTWMWEVPGVMLTNLTVVFPAL